MISVVCISGRAAAGKSTIAHMLDAAGNRSLISTGVEALDQFASDCRETSDPAGAPPGGGRRWFVMDGLHSLEDRRSLGRRFGRNCISIHVEASREVRMLRRLGWTEFDADFYREDDRTGTAIDRLKPGASYLVRNEGSEAELARRIRQIAMQVRRSDELP